MSVGLSVNNALTTNGSGMGAGIDVTTMVAEQMSVLREPETLLQQESATLSSQSTVLNQMNSELSALQSSFQSLTNFDGQFNDKSASSSDTSQLTAIADTTASTGTHTVVISNLATTSSYSSSLVASGDTTISQGTFYIQVGTNSAVGVTVGSSNDTLNTLASYINNQNLGVTASVITDSSGARLALYSQTSGAAGDLTISSSTNTTGLSFTKGATGKDALFTVDGISVTSSSNTITSVIPGVTLDLVGANSTTVQLSVQPDTTTAGDAVISFVNAYNTLISDINSQLDYNSTTDTSVPVLNGDSTVQLLQQQLYSGVSSAMSNNGSISSLADLGVTMNDDGTLSVDSTTLVSKLASNYSDVENFFQATGSFGQNFNSTLSTLTDPTSGSLTVELNSISSQQTDITSQIADMEANLAVKETQLTTEYTNVDTTLEELPLILADISAQIGSLKG
jgi:flagellar hook-associated protein 2